MFPPAVTFEAPPAVVITTINGGVLKVDAVDGQLRWKSQIATQISKGFAVGSDQSIYVAGFNGKLYALDGANGRVRWEYQATGAVQAPAAKFHGDSNADRIYLVDAQSNAITVDARNGNEVWRVALPGPATCDPVVTPAEVVYVGVGSTAASSRLVAVAEGGIRWTLPVQRGTVKALAVGEDGSICAAAGRSVLRVR
jgi:outer membrane protein assembly factor BamB